MKETETLAVRYCHPDTCAHCQRIRRKRIEAEAPAMLEALRFAKVILSSLHGYFESGHEQAMVAEQIDSIRAILARIDGEGK